MLRTDSAFSHLTSSVCRCASLLGLLTLFWRLGLLPSYKRVCVPVCLRACVRARVQAGGGRAGGRPAGGVHVCVSVCASRHTVLFITMFWHGRVLSSPEFLIDGYHSQFCLKLPAPALSALGRRSCLSSFLALGCRASRLAFPSSPSSNHLYFVCSFVLWLPGCRHVYE